MIPWRLYFCFFWHFFAVSDSVLRKIELFFLRQVCSLKPSVSHDRTEKRAKLFCSNRCPLISLIWLRSSLYQWGQSVLASKFPLSCLLKLQELIVTIVWYCMTVSDRQFPLKIKAKYLVTIKHIWAWFHCYEWGANGKNYEIIMLGSSWLFVITITYNNNNFFFVCLRHTFPLLHVQDTFFIV